MPAIEKIEKTVEVHHLQFSDQAVCVPFGMKDRCVQFTRTEDLEAHTDPAHRHDRCCFRVAATIAVVSEVEESVEVPPVQHIHTIGSIPVVMMLVVQTCMRL